MRGVAVRVAVVALLLGACTSTAAEQVVEPTEPVSTSSSTTTSTSTSTTTTSTTTTTTIPTYALSGRVLTGEGDRLGGAFVEVSGTRTTVGPDGWFLVAEVQAGEVTISRPGWHSVTVPWDGDAAPLEVTLEPVRVRALRVSAYVAQDADRFAALLDLADRSVVNALVFDTKQEGGTVLYETSVEEAEAIDAVRVSYDPVAHLAAAKELGLYTITRVVTFEDGIRARARPELKLAGEWVDPRDPRSWEYPLALAEEACTLGFDEIQFDYVRFPTGSAAVASRDLPQAERVETIRTFLEAARALLHPMGCAVSADIFGIVVSTPDDQGIGQIPEEVSTAVDAVSPMVYPSHYSLGWLGFADPNDHPYAVTADAVDDGTPRLAHPAVMRPWLQAFWWTDAEIKESIRAAEERGAGWMLWNAAGNYGEAALPTADELEQWAPVPPEPAPTSTSTTTTTTEAP
ncbi:MAG: hypothetical protein HKN46_05925 [Acidimicrobiia bacterium]|nr:hypothetical protein [Acidimicrobiia bacterium]